MAQSDMPQKLRLEVSERTAMKITVITVTRNNVSTIQATLDSVAAQDYAEVEHVVIDGASTDGTTELVRARGTRVGTLVSEPDKGIYDAMNKGIRHATGEVIAFLNGDDVYAHSGVLSHVAAILQGKQVGLVYGDVEFFRPERPGQAIRRYRSGHFSPRQLAWGWMPAHPAMFVRTRLFESAGVFRTDYRIAGDYEWIVRVFKNHAPSYAHTSQVLVHMLTGGASTAGWRSTLRLNREVIRACRENGLKTNWFMILSKYPLKLLEYVRR